MSDPKMIRGIQEAVSIPVMAKCRIGHFVEAQILEAIEIDYIDESEVLSPADDIYHINKKEFKVPFVCGARDLGEALRRIAEGASMIRTKGEPGTGDVVQAVRHMRAMNAEIRRIQNLRADELFEAAKLLQVPVDLVEYVHENGKLPVVNFAAGGVATPADAALMMQLGAEGVFVGSGIFKSGNPAKRAASIVKAVTNYTDAKLIAELSTDLGEAMVGINEQEIELLMAENKMTIAILAMQGAFLEHGQMLDRLGVEHFEIRKKEDLDRSFDGLILPGGESTVMRKLLIELNIYDILKKKIEDGLPVFGTCAGLILLAEQVEDGVPCFGTMNILAKRNAYGRQLGSFYIEDEMKEIGKIPMTFIRAPYIDDVYGEAEILAVVDGKVVAARQGSQLATAFHPELNDDTSVHAYFVEMIKGSKAQAV